MSGKTVLPKRRIARRDLAKELEYRSSRSVARAHRNGTLPLAFVVVAGQAWYDLDEVDAYVRSQRRDSRSGNSPSARALLS